MTVEECRQRKRAYRRLAKRLYIAKLKGEPMVIKSKDFECLRLALTRTEAVEEFNIKALED